MRVGVSGGRNYDRWQVIHPVLNKFHYRYGIVSLLQGEADGADFCAKAWAMNNRIKVESFPAAWDDIHRPGAAIKYNKYGKPYDAKAGFHRNREMANSKPDLFIIFPGGKGTRDMRETAVDRKIPTFVVPDREWEQTQAFGDDELIISFDDDRPVQKPYWAYKPRPDQRWEVIDHEAKAAAERRRLESRDRYLAEAMF